DPRLVLHAACDLDAAFQAERLPQRHLPRARGRSEGKESFEVARQRARPQLLVRKLRVRRGALVFLHVDPDRRELPDRSGYAAGNRAAVLHTAVELLLVLRPLRAARFRSGAAFGADRPAARPGSLAPLQVEHAG